MGIINDMIFSSGGNFAPFLYILGQSNGAGQQFPLTDLDSSLRVPQSDIQVAFYAGAQGNTTTFNFVDLDPASVPYPWTNNVWGLEMGLMPLLRNYYQSETFLAKFTLGGRPISDFLSGGLFYNAMQKVDDDAESYLNNVGKQIKYLPAIWIQGEANVTSSVASYQAGLQSVLDNIRAKSDPNRAFIMQKLSSRWQTCLDASPDNVNQAFDNIVAANTNCYIVDPSGIDGMTMDHTSLDVQTPCIHYGSADFIERLAPAYFNLMRNEGLL